MSILIGANLGDITNLTKDYLPKSAIDRATIRMAELLQNRMGVASNIANPTIPAQIEPSTTNESATEEIINLES